MQWNRRATWTRLPRLVAVIGAASAAATAMAAGDPGRSAPGPRNAPSQPQVKKPVEIVVGPELTPDVQALKDRLAAQDNIPGELRGPGPVNDLCTGAIDLATLGFAAGATVNVNTDNTNATADTVPACGFTNTSQSSGSLGIWYKFTGTGNYVEFSTCQQATDMTIRAFCGPDCGTLSCVGADDDGCVTNSLGSRLGWCTASGTQYWVLIARYGTVTAGAPFAFTVTDNNTACGTAACGAPANDDCGTAQSIAVGASARGNTSNATIDSAAQTGCGASFTGQQGVWYQATGNGHILRATTCGATTGANSVVSVFSGACGALTCVGTNATLACGTSPRDDTASVDWTSTAAAPYYILISNDGNGAGDFLLSLSDVGVPATNDLCSTAQTVGLPSSTAGNNFGATNDAGLPTCSALTTWNNGVWFKFTGNGNRVSASTCDPATQLNTRVYVFTTPDCTTFTCVGANATASPACAAPATAATVAFCSTLGQDYYVLVTNDTTGTGTFQLVISDLGPVGCQPTGACCSGGSCTITTQAGCTGTYLGTNTSCNPGSQNPNLAVPDSPAPAVSTSITIPAAGAPTITALTVGFVMPHTWQGDLVFTLTHVDTATTVTLVDRPGYPNAAAGFSADNYGNPTTNTPFVLDDAAAVPYDDASAGGNTAQPGIVNPTGPYKPQQPLAAFNGQSMAGTWTLSVQDMAGGDTGTVLFWSLNPTPALPSPCPTGPDCFTRGAAGAPSSCPPSLTHVRPTNAGHFAMGGANGAADAGDCKPDWDGDGCRTPADVASFVASWFYSANNPGNTDGDYNCDNTATPADVASFVSEWFDSLTNPATHGC